MVWRWWLLPLAYESNPSWWQEQANQVQLNQSNTTEHNRIQLNVIKAIKQQILCNIQLRFDCVRQWNRNYSIVFDCVQLIRRSIPSIDTVWHLQTTTFSGPQFTKVRSHIITSCYYRFKRTNHRPEKSADWRWWKLPLTYESNPNWWNDVRTIEHSQGTLNMIESQSNQSYIPGDINRR